MESDLGHYLLGGSPETLRRLKGAIARDHPGTRIVGSQSPPYRPLTGEELAAQDAEIARTKPDIIWIGLGTPKQDFEALRLSRSLQVVTVAVGAAFDYRAGVLREAPSLVRYLGAEWLFRFAMEPRRLFTRYTKYNLVFLRSIFRQILRRRS